MGETFALDGDTDDEVRIDPTKDWIEGYQAEIDTYFKQMRKFNEADPASTFQRLSAWSARAAEMRSQLFRVDSRRCAAFRTRQVDPFLEEVDRQFKIHSRIQAIREMEFRLDGGRFT